MKHIENIKQFESVEQNFFYFTKEGEFIICDIGSAEKSNRTFDMTVSELTNNSELLNSMNLIDMTEIYDDNDKAFKSFCFYLSSFGPTDINYSKTSLLKMKKLIGNPTIRIIDINGKLKGLDKVGVDHTNEEKSTKNTRQYIESTEKVDHINEERFMDASEDVVTRILYFYDLCEVKKKGTENELAKEILKALSNMGVLK